MLLYNIVISIVKHGTNDFDTSKSYPVLQQMILATLDGHKNIYFVIGKTSAPPTVYVITPIKKKTTLYHKKSVTVTVHRENTTTTCTKLSISFDDKHLFWNKLDNSAHIQQY